jgi:flagellar basal-body rod protein FlgC
MGIKVNTGLSPIEIAVSGLRAESARMNVVATNIANANTTQAADGQPYRRKFLVTQTSGDGVGGVRVGQVAQDESPFKRVYEPGNPDAEDGWLSTPNIDVPREMMDMVAASRAYQANAAVMKRYQEVLEVALELLR